jgi:hypothetical protein
MEEAVQNIGSSCQLCGSTSETEKLSCDHSICRKCKDTLVNSEELQIQQTANPSEVTTHLQITIMDEFTSFRGRSTVQLANNQLRFSVTRRGSVNLIVQVDQLQLWSAMSVMLLFVMHVLHQVTEDHSKITQNTKSEKEERGCIAKIIKRKSTFTATNAMQMFA